ncbi:MAG TPA: phosphate signaling complex protein PhoU [Synergistaceae bacterium]|nr:phosphate signaling complex protein PhoU [Synergistaceae bacterium]
MKTYLQKIKAFFNRKAIPSAEELLFSEDRKRLLELLFEMGDAVGKALELVMEALEERNPEKAALVIAQDSHIDELESELEQQCLHVMALRRPIRDNLRFLIALIKVAGDLERTGDQATNIAEKVTLFGKAPLLKPLVDIPRMGSITREMTDYALKSFEMGDPRLALEIHAMDDEVDRLYKRVFEDILLLISRKGLSDREDMEQAMNLVLIARYLERIGDQAVNVARRSYFMVTGKSMDREIEASKETEKSRGAEVL